MKKQSFIISGGGTGGHIYPAIAIADALKEKYPNADFMFVGASDRMEMQKIPNAGYEIKGLWISGLQRGQLIKNLLLPFKLISSLWGAYKVIKKQKPIVAIGTGGYASAALLKMAGWVGVPTVVQEQNSFPGITNKLLANDAAKICVAEVEELVPVGELDPNTIHIPGIFIQRIFQGEQYEKRIEQLTLTQQV